MWQWSAYAVARCDGVASEYLSIYGNPAGLYFQNVTRKGSNSFCDRLTSVWAIALREVTANESFLCDRWR
jgi:hypothetical protein